MCTAAHKNIKVKIFSCLFGGKITQPVKNINSMLKVILPKEYPKLYKKRDVLTDIWVYSKIDRYVAIDIHLSF